MISFRRRVFTSGGTSSSNLRAARVPGLSEYWNMNAASKPTSSKRLSVSLWSSSLSPQKPAITSVVRPQSGTISLILATLSRYHLRSYLRLIFSSIASLPDWTGKCICLHILLCAAIV